MDAEARLDAETTFIYALYDPRGGGARYVGKADDPSRRLKQHLKETAAAARRGAHTHRTAWLQSLADAGVEPELRVIDRVPTELWVVAEQAWIRDFRLLGCDLVNGTDGGDGSSGGVHSDETRERMSQASLGRPKTPEHRRNISAGRTGIRVSEAGRQKIRDRMAGRAPSRRMVEAAAAATRGVPRSAEVRRRISEGHQRRAAALAANSHPSTSTAVPSATQAQ